MATPGFQQRALASRLPGGLAMLAATGVTSYAFARTLSFHVPLRVVLGPTFWAVEAGLGSGILAELLVLARECRRLGAGERRSQVFGPLRELFVVLVLFWIFCLAWMQPFERLWFEMAFGIAVGAWAGLVAADSAIARLPATLRRISDVSLFSLCASLVLLEVSLRAIALVRPSPIFARASDPGHQGIAQIGVNRAKPGTLRFGFPCNQGGHYDDEFHRKIPPEKLVVSIGDSFGRGIVPHPFHFTTVCEKELGCPVDSMGIAGCGPPEYLSMLVNEALPLDPDVIVIDVFVGNDLDVPYANPASWSERARAWFLRENVLLWVVPDRLMRIAREKRRRPEADGKVADVHGTDVPFDASKKIEEQFPWCLDPGLEKPTLSESTYFGIEVSRATKMARLTPTALMPFQDKMLEMKRSAGSTPLVVMLIPDVFQTEDDLWSQIVESARGASLERERAQALLVPWFERIGIPCLDLLPVIRAEKPTGDGHPHLYHSCDTHFNARGNRVAGEALATFLRRFLE